ncbi:MAG: outer membrane beta-barrel protein [Candidatus Sulfotelmatobacter sp.]
MSKFLRSVLIFAFGFGMLLSNASAQTATRMQLGVNYDYVGANAPPGDCGCFSLNGGSGWFGYNLDRGLALIGDVSVTHASYINATDSDLTLTSYLFGPRYSRVVRSRFLPFAQVLIGGAHASGALATSSSGVAASANSFAMALGGGLDIPVTHRLAFRPIQVDYYLTRFPNGVNDHQNNFRVGMGMVFSFWPQTLSLRPTHPVRLCSEAADSCRSRPS